MIPRIRGPFERAEEDFVLQGAHHPYVVSDPSGRWWVLKPLQPRGILAESIGGLVGRLIGVEVPEFAVFDEDDRRAIDMESALVGMPRALSSKGTRPPRPHALPSDFALVEPMREAACEAAQVAVQAPEATIRELVDIAMDVAGTLDRDVLRSALLARCRHAPGIVEDYLELIPRATAMFRQYRLLQYIVDPFARRRVTVAALIQDDASVQVVMAPDERVQQGAGRLRARKLLAALRRDVEALSSFERLPRAFGPQFVLTTPEPIPPGDPLGWVQARLFSART